MKKSTFKSIVVLSLSLLCFGLNAQNSSKLWTPVSERAVSSKVKEFRNSVPTDYKLFSLNTPALQSILATAPSRANLKNSNVIIELPVGNGELQKFRVVDASNFAPELQQRHPDIRSFAGQGIEDPSAVARFSVSPYTGVHVMITSAKHPTVYVDPYTQDKGQYISYSRKDLPSSLEPFVCLVEEQIGPRPNIDENASANRNADDGMLRTFRLALAANGEYSLWHLNNQGIDPAASDAIKKAAVLSAQNVAMTRVNGIYERDVAITMVIIPNNEDIIFLNPATDGLDNTSNVINQIQAKIDGIIGFPNYDIGHVFTTGGGGIAQLRSPCTANKARGVTGLPAPINDPFYVDYVSHEMGHQFGGNHTQNNNCQRSNASYEPGSASTIMGYAGICPPNVQNVSDDYFHGYSIQEMWNFVSVGQGQCAVQTPTNNLPPDVDAGPDYTIPKSTPFVLKGTAMDPDGDILSYCWEQLNSNPAPMPPLNTSILGPAFRSIDPLDSPDRYMPMISTVLAGQLGGPGTSNIWEVVPSVARTMNFRLTVRDNVAGGGASQSDNMLLTFDGASGPFVVTSQATPTNWTIGDTETITWDVAGTDVAPVSCSNVDIWFSTDGGITYPISIALNVPNTGSAVIDVPNVNTTTGRLMVMGSDNIFYDLNDDVITVDGTVGVDDFTFENFAVYPNPSNGTFNLSFKPASNDNIEVSLYDLRGRAINQYTFDDVAASTTFSKQLNYNYIESGMYFLVVKNGNKVTTKKIVKN
ncbi:MULTISPECIES: reprolysin-like metallopeptidase [Aequorivita]|uniref:T9SS type A sorting domain-containing protein n=1 Tax=Aequorivita iocasae TaxID=2803865 RepID=A0ABX7DUD1_9FLAO|nr:MULTISPECIES: zinc-dependent metalloprotease family protein [Aequorivita]QQX77216.1 T9SS type A sorting domain-containing protein [Aequorivita iocasae]UCA56703.1 M12 family metallo-peptidase [Aequorivita sp. F7]